MSRPAPGRRRHWALSGLGTLALAAALAALGLATLDVLAPPATLAQSAKPNYLSFAEFAASDGQLQIDLKKAYNDAVERYNQVLYDYHAILEQHDHLVDLFHGSSDPDERARAKEEAAPLRARLNTLKRDAATLYTAVDQAARRAQAAGVPIRP
jgi:hypothetical protein